MVKGLDHIAVIVSTEESITFYETLGFNMTNDKAFT